MAGYGDRWTADERLSDRRILVVDDEPAIAQLVARLLQEDGYLRLRVTSSPAQAMPLFAELQPHLMLLDLVMPQPDGFAVLKQLMPLLGETYVPVLILTADVGSAAKAQAFALGAVDYVTKPIDKVELLARVRSALRLKEAIDRRAMRERELLEVTQALVEAKQQVEEGMKALDRQHRLLQEEQERSERLLINVLPKPVAEILKLHHRVVAQRFADASILFADIVDFTKMSADMSPEQVVELLNDVFSAFDGLAERHRLEKIKTIGDAYMVVGGVPTPREAHLESLADMALDMLEETARYTPGNGRSLGLRIGIHAGPVVAGVVGTKKFLYDLWGDTVNIASRMESLGLPGAIHITEDVARRLAGPYRVEQRGSVRVKGKGEMVTYFLLGRTAGAQET